MPLSRTPRSSDSDTLQKILEVTRQSFILQALQAGMDAKTVRKMLEVDYWRVIEISKCLRQIPRKPQGGG
jgi:hypothetical protein